MTKVAVIGCGYWGKNLVRNFAQLGALAAVCDAHAPNAEAQSKLHNVPITSLEEIWADKTIDAVVIAAPAAQHAELASAALKAGKHAFVEKPLALTVAEAEMLGELAAKHKRVLMVGHLLQYHPAYLKLRGMVEAGEFGKLVHVYSNRLNLGKLRTEENALWSFGPHDISMILGLLGDVAEVSAQGAVHVTDKVADVVSAQMSFKNGAKAHVFVSWLHPSKEQKLVVVGEKLMAVFDDGEPLESKLRLYRHTIDRASGQPVPVKADAEPVALDTTEPLRNECQHFLDACAGKHPARTDAAEGTRVLKVLNAAEQSMRTGKAVRMGQQFNDVFVHETAVVDDGAKLGKGTKVWHFAHVLPGVTIGENCVISQNVMIGPDVTVGNDCKIQNNVSLYKGVELADNVFCGPSCVFTNVNTPRAGIERKNEYLPTKVGTWATIGANATIVCGNELGAYCLIGAGAVVTKPVKPHALMVGNPAKQTGWVSHAGEVLGDDLVCPREKRKYRVENDTLVELESKDARVA